MQYAGRSARLLATALVPVLMGAFLPGCDSGRFDLRPPFIAAVVIGFPSGVAPPGFEGVVVDVLNPETGAPVTYATVTVNGLAVPWNPEAGAYKAGFTVQPGAPVDLAVTFAGETYRATANSFSEGPSILLPNSATWASRCENRLAWSGATPGATNSTLVAILDAAAPAVDAAYGPTYWVAPGSGDVTVPPRTLTPGDRLAFVGVTSEFAVSGAFGQSRLVLVGARTAPLTVVDADYGHLTISPANRGLGTGEALPLQLKGVFCGRSSWTDLTAEATWSSSDTEIIHVSNAVGSAGVATGAGPGTAVISADVQGIRGSTIMGVRDFTSRHSTLPGEMLGGVTWTGTTVIAVGTGGTVLSSPDGITWTRRPTGTLNQLTSVAASPDLVAAVEYGTSAVLVSPDLVTWTKLGAPVATSGLYSIIWTGDEFVAVGIGGAIVTSADGLTWTGRASGTPYTLAAVASGASRLVAVGGYGAATGQVVTSQDAVIWMSHDLPSDLGYLRAVTYAGNQFVAMGDYWPLASPDGVNWTKLNGPARMRAIAPSPGEMMAVGDHGEVATSPDGSTWITWTLGDLRLNGLTWAGTHWVIVGQYETIFTTP